MSGKVVRNVSSRSTRRALAVRFASTARALKSSQRTQISGRARLSGSVWGLRNADGMLRVAAISDLRAARACVRSKRVRPAIIVARVSIAVRAVAIVVMRSRTPLLVTPFWASVAEVRASITASKTHKATARECRRCGGESGVAIVVVLRGRGFRSYSSGKSMEK